MPFTYHWMHPSPMQPSCCKPGRSSLSWILKMNGGSPENKFRYGLLTSDKWCQLYDFHRKKQKTTKVHFIHTFVGLLTISFKLHKKIMVTKCVTYTFSPQFCVAGGQRWYLSVCTTLPCFEAVSTGKNVYKHSRWTNYFFGKWDDHS